jgi:hypothetical protein
MWSVLSRKALSLRGMLATAPRRKQRNAGECFARSGKICAPWSARRTMLSPFWRRNVSAVPEKPATSSNSAWISSSLLSNVFVVVTVLRSNRVSSGTTDS